MRSDPKSVWIVGSGPSVTASRLAALRECYTVCLNDSIFHVPEPNVHLFMDGIWERYREIDYWQRGIELVSQWGNVNRLVPAGSWCYPRTVKVRVARDFSRIPELPCLRFLDTVATSAIDYCMLTGVERIYLIGVDCWGDSYFWGDPRSKSKKPRSEIDGKMKARLKEQAESWREALGRTPPIHDASGSLSGIYPHARLI